MLRVALHNGIIALNRRDTRDLAQALYLPGKDTARRQLSVIHKELSPEHNRAGTLTLEFPAFKTVRNKFLSCNPLSWASQVSSSKESLHQYRRCKRHRFDPWSGMIHWSRKWQPAPVFLSGKFHGQRSLAGYSPWGCNESDMTEHSHTVYSILLQQSEETNTGFISKFEAMPWTC